MLFQIKAFLLDLLFPVQCAGCGLAGEWFCSDCTGQVRFRHLQYCPVCRKGSDAGRVCAGCRGESALTGLWAAASYEDNPGLARAVRNLKYKFAKPLVDNLGKILLQALPDFATKCEPMLTFVPLYSRRQRWRGFNQAEILAQVVGRQSGLSIQDLLVRQKNTPQQAKLRRVERLRNLAGAFQIADRINVQGRIVILVDDVASTCATLDECAQVLKTAGAKEVWGLVLARG